MFKLKNKFAFTLAETLITLTLIGIVAAITIPMVSGNFHEKIVVTKVKKFYANMSQLLQDAIVENYGYSVSKWNYQKGKPDQLMEYFRPHLSILKDCGYATDCLWTGMYKKLNGGDQMKYGADNRYYKLILADGSHVWFRTHVLQNNKCGDSDCYYSNVCAMFWYDINGEKEPNVVGKDTFAFVITENNGTNKFVPCRDNNYETCTKTGSGFGCSEKAISQGKLYR